MAYKVAVKVRDNKAKQPKKKEPVKVLGNAKPKYLSDSEMAKMHKQRHKPMSKAIPKPLGAAMMLRGTE